MTDYKEKMDRVNLVGKIIYDWHTQGKEADWEDLHPDSLSRQLMLTPAFKIVEELCG